MITIGYVPYLHGKNKKINSDTYENEDGENEDDNESGNDDEDVIHLTTAL